MNKAQHEADLAEFIFDSPRAEQARQVLPLRTDQAEQAQSVEDAVELAAVVLDKDELGRRREARLKTLYKQSRRFGGLWYKCVVCSQAREMRDINEVKNHIISEHGDALNQVEAVMQGEVVAGRESNCGVGLEQLAGRGKAGTDGGRLRERPGQVLAPRAEQGLPPKKKTARRTK